MFLIMISKVGSRLAQGFLVCFFKVRLFSSGAHGRDALCPGSQAEASQARGAKDATEARRRLTIERLFKPVGCA